jgi:hypothetical protein
MTFILCFLRFLLFQDETYTMHPNFAKADRLYGEVIGAAIEVHRTMGPASLQSIYEPCSISMRSSSLKESQGLSYPVQTSLERKENQGNEEREPSLKGWVGHVAGDILRGLGFDTRPLKEPEVSGPVDEAILPGILRNHMLIGAFRAGRTMAASANPARNHPTVCSMIWASVKSVGNPYQFQ